MASDVLIAQCGSALAALCSAATPLSHEDLCQDLRGARPALLRLLRFAWSLRRNRRSRRPWSDVLTAVRQPRPAPWCRALLQHTYALYNVIRSRAVPYLPRAPGRALFRGYVPRALARVLRRHGVVAFREEDRANLRNQAATAVAALWDSLPGWRVGLWYDNFYRARYLANPARGYSSLNSSVLAMVPLPALPATAPDVMTYAHARGGLPQAARTAAFAAGELERLTDVFRNRRHLPGDIRVPLDVQRPAVTSLVWRPFQVSEVCVSSQTGLLRFLRFSGRLARRSQCGVAPVLVDENIHYRLHKLAWSEPFLRWDVPRYLEVVPPLFGVWHAYKYCVIQVARKLHSVLWYAIRGTLPAGAHVPTGPPLRSYELAFAGLLQAPLSLRQRVTAMRRQWADLHDQDEMRLHVVATDTSRTQTPTPNTVSPRARGTCNSKSS